MMHCAEADRRVYQAISNAMGKAIQSYLESYDIIEIMLNPDGKLWVERLGYGIENTGYTLKPLEAEAIIRLVASRCGEECNKEKPSLSAIIPMANARFQAFVAPIVDSPSFSIRKRALQVFSLDNYVEHKILSAQQREILIQAVHAHKNILIVGGTGSGKTTFANALLNEIAQTNERIITIEDTAELQCTAPNTVQLYTKADIDFSMREALKGVLRFRPDRIIVGEVRDGSALDLLKAWNTGHSGGLATIHANNATLALERLESLISEVAVHVPKKLIAEAINLIVFIQRTPSGRKVREICELKGIQNDGYILHSL